LLPKRSIENQMRAIISCPYCFETTGDTFNLAEYLPQGILSIRTFYKTFKGENIPLYIKGNEFELICGNCKQVAFRKTPVLIQQTTTLLFGTV